MHLQVKEALPVPTDVPCHNIQPGDYVFVKEHRKKNSLTARWEGPFQLLLITHTAVKVKERRSWIHASHVRRTADPTELIDPVTQDPSLEESPEDEVQRTEVALSNQTVTKPASTRSFEVQPER